MIRTTPPSGLRPWALSMLLLALALPAPALAQEAAVTRRATELRATPADGGRSLAALPAQAPLTRLAGRQGPWVQVRTPEGATGWLHLFDLAPAAAPGATAGGNAVGDALRGVTGLFGRSSAQPSSAAAGIRGLDAEDLAQARPDPAAVRRMDALRQDDAQARAFASAAGLRPVAVEPLPAPARAATAAPGAHPSNPSNPESP